jgi:hypothetical protein
MKKHLFKGPMLSHWWEWPESQLLEDHIGQREWTLPELWGERETAHQRWGDRPGDEG